MFNKRYLCAAAISKYGNCVPRLKRMEILNSIAAMQTLPLSHTEHTHQLSHGVPGAVVLVAVIQLAARLTRRGSHAARGCARSRRCSWCLATISTTVVPHTQYNNKNNIRLVTLAEDTSDHGKQTNSSTKERGSRARKLLGANAKSYRQKLKTK